MIKLVPNKVMQGTVGDITYTISRFDEFLVAIVATKISEDGTIIGTEVVGDSPMTIEKFMGWSDDIMAKHGNVFDKDHIDYFVSEKNLTA